MIMRLCTQKAYSTSAATVFLTGGIYLNLSPKPWTQGQGTSVANKNCSGLSQVKTVRLDATTDRWPLPSINVLQ